VLLECLIRKDDGGVRILVRDVKMLDDFIKNTKPAENDFEDIKKQFSRNGGKNFKQQSEEKGQLKKFEEKNLNNTKEESQQKIYLKIEIKIINKDSILSLKNLLSQNLEENLNQKLITEVFIKIGDKNIKLAQKYFFDKENIFLLKAIKEILLTTFN
jgi:hypothetical protein